MSENLTRMRLAFGVIALAAVLAACSNAISVPPGPGGGRVPFAVPSTPATGATSPAATSSASPPVTPSSAPPATPTPTPPITPTPTPPVTPSSPPPAGAPSFPPVVSCGSFPDPNSTTVAFTGTDGQIINVPQCGDAVAVSRVTGNDAGGGGATVTIQASNDNKLSNPATLTATNGTPINESSLMLSKTVTFTSAPDTCVKLASPTQIIDNPYVTYTVEVESFGSDSQALQTGLTPDSTGNIRFQLTSPLGGGKQFPGGVTADIVVYRQTSASAQPRSAGNPAGCPSF